MFSQVNIRICLNSEKCVPFLSSHALVVPPQRLLGLVSFIIWKILNLKVFSVSYRNLFEASSTRCYRLQTIVVLFSGLVQIKHLIYLFFLLNDLPSLPDLGDPYAQSSSIFSYMVNIFVGFYTSLILNILRVLRIMSSSSLHLGATLFCLSKIYLHTRIFHRLIQAPDMQFLCI